MGSLSEFLRDELATRGWGPTELAERAGVSRASVRWALDHPDAVPTLKMLEAVGDVLGVPLWRMVEIAGFTSGVPGDLASRVAALAATDPERQALLARLPDLSPEDAAAVLAFLEAVQRRRDG